MSHRWSLRVLSAPTPWAVLAAACVGLWVASQVIAQAGGPALPLDDAFIHLQYARQLSSGSWFSYVEGGGYTTGATSWLWPMAIAPGFWFGLNGSQLVWVSWLFGCLLHAGTIVEAARLARGLAGEVAAWAVAAVCLVFPAFAWFAYSGMETMALAYVLTLGARLASEVAEGARGRGAMQKLLGVGLLAPLVRPEGALVSVMACAGLAVAMRSRHSESAGDGWPVRPFSRVACVLAPLGGPLIIPLSHWSFSGHAMSSTAQVKWLLADPYLDRAGVWRATLANVQLMLSDLLQGGIWTNRFLPEGFLWALLLGLASMVWLALRCGRGWRALFVFAVVVGTFGVCSYETMLWNRVRYIWPFAPAWFVVASCFPVALSKLLVTGGRRNVSVRRSRAMLGIIAPISLGGGVAWVAMKLPSAIDDVAESARAIELQQVKLGRWAKAHLPASARVGVNDTGAIAYFSGRPTFDVVGLTTEGEARYWAAGSGSRFEHYERLGVSRLPTHFIVYPNWMGISQVLGPELTRATVIEQSILGGRTMVAYEADYARLGSGASPIDIPPGAKRLAELDVADLQSEAEHRYLATDGRARDDRPVTGVSPQGETLVDGGRHRRLEDRFVLGPLSSSTMVIRADASAPLQVWVDGQKQVVPRLGVKTTGWQEYEISLAASEQTRTVRVRRVDGGRFTSLHYWWYAHSPAAGDSVSGEPLPKVAPAAN